MQRGGIYASDKTNEIRQNTHRSPLMRPLRCLSVPHSRHLLMPDTVKTPRNTNNTADQRQIVRTRVAVSAIAADHLARATAVSTGRVRVLVQDASIYKVEDVA